MPIPTRPRPLAPTADREPYQLHRRDGPSTSEEAAEHAVKLLGERQRWAAECVRRSPGLTARELAGLYCPDDPKRIDRRLGECAEIGTVWRGEPRRCSRSGRRATTWWPYPPPALNPLPTT